MGYSRFKYKKWFPFPGLNASRARFQEPVIARSPLRVIRPFRTNSTNFGLWQDSYRAMPFPAYWPRAATLRAYPKQAKKPASGGADAGRCNAPELRARTRAPSLTDSMGAKLFPVLGEFAPARNLGPLTSGNRGRHVRISRRVPSPDPEVSKCYGRNKLRAAKVDKKQTRRFGPGGD
jgi:hypothetical protein